MTTEQAPGAHGDPSHSVEIELKFDVDEDTAVPDWSALPGVATTGVAEVRELDAQYFDTTGLALGRAGYALRRRSGGPDAGWHIKGPRQGLGRSETHWPLTDDDTVPEALRTAVAPLTDAELHPLARIRNTRTAYALSSATGELVAEFDDDRVRTVDERTGTERAWREWEVELGPGAPTDESARHELLGAIAQAAFAAGARRARSASKIGRALGY